MARLSKTLLIATLLLTTACSTKALTKVEQYESQVEASGKGLYPVLPHPKVVFGEDITEQIVKKKNYAAIFLAEAVHDVVAIVNKRLPKQYQMAVVDNVSEATITFKYSTRAEIRQICNETSELSCAYSIVNVDDKFTKETDIYVAEDIDSADVLRIRVVVLHELLHALGIQGHVDGATFPDSVLRTGYSFPEELTIPEIDNQIIQYMYR